MSFQENLSYTIKKAFGRSLLMSGFVVGFFIFFFSILFSINQIEKHPYITIAIVGCAAVGVIACHWTSYKRHPFPTDMNRMRFPRVYLGYAVLIIGYCIGILINAHMSEIFVITIYLALILIVSTDSAALRAFSTKLENNFRASLKIPDDQPLSVDQIEASCDIERLESDIRYKHAVKLMKWKYCYRLALPLKRRITSLILMVAGYVSIGIMLYFCMEIVLHYRLGLEDVNVKTSMFLAVGAFLFGNILFSLYLYFFPDVNQALLHHCSWARDRK